MWVKSDEWILISWTKLEGYLQEEVDLDGFPLLHCHIIWWIILDELIWFWF
jgi:hypothetical protein